jgi:hypothetical protein
MSFVYFLISLALALLIVGVLYLICFKLPTRKYFLCGADFVIFKNKKNQEDYRILCFSVIDATNGREKEEEMILYAKGEKIFVRKKSEFFEKFERVLNEDLS